MKFSICLIAKNEEKTLPRLLKSLEDFKNKDGEVVLVDTGSSDLTVQIARDWGCKVEEVGEKFIHVIDDDLAESINKHFVVGGENSIVKSGDRYFDFASARNYAASLATNDVVSFADADEGFTKLDTALLNKLIESGFTQFEYQFVFAHDEYGNEAIKFIQSKMYDRRKMSWVGLVHEVLQGESKRITLDESSFKLEHWQQPGDRHSYLVGLAVDCYLHQDKDRNSHYFARELMWSNRPNSALLEFSRHITMGGWSQEMAQSLIFMGDCYGRIGEPEKQAQHYHKAFYVDSSRREALIKLAYFYLHNKNYQAAVCYAKAAMEVPWNAFYANQVSDYTTSPHEILYQAYGWLGRISEAQEHITKCLEYQPQNPQYLRDRPYYFEGFEYHEQGIQGWMSLEELNWLYKQAKEADSILEVGSWKGRSTHALLSGAKTTTPVTAVDTFKGSLDPRDLTNQMAKQEDILEIFKQNTKEFKNLKIVQKESLEAAKDVLDSSIDFIFIDAGHTYEEVKADILAWLPKVKPGGMLAGDDYLPNTWMGVVQAVDELVKPDGFEGKLWYKYVDKEQVIPKKIITMWLGDEPSEMVKKIIETQKIPGYEHKLVTLENCPKDIPYVNAAIEAKKWVKAVDYLKAYYLYHEGGIFLDADMEILPGQNFDDMLSNDLFAGVEENGFVGYSLVGSKPGHGVFAKYLKDVPERFKGDDDLFFESSMEVFTNLVFADPTCKLYSHDYFFPYNHQTGVIEVTENSRTFHHFMKSWTNVSDLLPRISIILPTLGRPEGLKRCLDSIDRLYYPKHLLEVIIEEGDDTVPIKVKRGLEKAKGDFILYASNDIEFTSKSLYLAVKMAKDYDLVAFNTGELFPDEGNISEHFLIRKDFIQKLENGEIFSTDFHHVGTDNWLWEQVNKLGRATRCQEAVVFHYHFTRGNTMDAVYEKGWSHVEQDRQVLKQKLAKLNAVT